WLTSSRSEVQLPAEFEQAPRKNLRRRKPRRTVPSVDAEDGARVQEIVDVHRGVEMGAPDLHGLREAEVDLIEPLLVQRPGRNQIDGGGATSACRQAAAERRRDFGVGGDVTRGDLGPREPLVGGARPEKI